MGVAGAVCTIAVVDLEAACALYGRDTLPQPLGRSRPVGSVWLLRRDVEPIEDRLRDGDLRAARTWVEALVRAEATVQCRVSFSDAGDPELRVHGVRAGASGYVAAQRRDRDGVDVVDIHAVSPYALSEAVVQSAGLVGAGGRIRVAAAGREDLPAPPAAAAEYDDFGFLIPGAEPRDAALEVVDGHKVVAIGTVRTWKDADRHWGGEATRHVLQWIQIDGDGDYLYAPGGAGYAEPLDAQLLGTCIDELIAG